MPVEDAGRRGRLAPAGALVLAALCAALVLAACGGSLGNVATPPTTPLSSSAASTAPAAATSVAAPMPGASDSGIKCGTERWPVKTMSDRDAGRVNPAAVPATVAQLRALPEPQSRPEDGRIEPTELTVFSLDADIVELKLEDDRDIHVVIADPTDRSATMIVEFPDADTCSGAVDSTAAVQMRQARSALVAAFGEPGSSSFRRVSGRVRLTGVGFFDLIHGQTGVAPNGIELHPVLSFSPDAGAPAQQQTAPSGTPHGPGGSAPR